MRNGVIWAVIYAAATAALFVGLEITTTAYSSAIRTGGGLLALGGFLSLVCTVLMQRGDVMRKLVRAVTLTAIIAGLALKGFSRASSHTAEIGDVIALIGFVFLLCSIWTRNIGSYRPYQTPDNAK